MKARFITNAALSVSALVFAAALPAAAQQAKSPAPAPAASSAKAASAEKAFVQKMDKVVQDGKKAGALNMDAVSKVFSDAAKLPVSDATMGKLVSMVSSAFPSEAPQVAAAAVKGYGSNVSESQVRNVVASAVSVQPKPYASVAPICDAVDKALTSNGASAVASMPHIATSVAEATPDNPLNAVEVRASTADTHHENIAAHEVGGGSLVMPGGIPVGATPTSADPQPDSVVTPPPSVSPANGAD